MPVVTIRPPPGDAATIERAATMGLTVQGHAMFAVEAIAWSVPDPADLDAILIGSANAIRHGGAGLATLVALPALCVGQATAEAAEAAGFSVCATGSRGLQSLLPHALARQMTRLLRLSGDAPVPLDLPQGMRIETRSLYTVRPHPMPSELVAILREPTLVLLHSGEAATHFAAECDRLGIMRAEIALACLAPRIAQCAGTGWAACEAAPSPDDPALLAMAMQMCQSR